MTLTMETKDEREAAVALLKTCRMMLGWAGTKPRDLMEMHKRGELCKCKNPAQWCVANKGPEET